MTGHTGPAQSNGLQHLVLNVRDIHRSHTFWTEVIGFALSGEIDRPDVHMRFYRATEARHHDVAIMQSRDVEAFPPVTRFDMSPKPGALVNHIAIEYDRDAWEQQVAHVKETAPQTIVFEIRHGMSHSLYLSDPDGNGVELLWDLPSESWAHDVDAALNYFRVVDQGPFVREPAPTPADGEH